MVEINNKNYERLKNIKILQYDEINKGPRRCNVCLAFTREETEIDRVIGAHYTDKMFELTIGGGYGGFEIILCKDCLKELKEKIDKEFK